jgi:hypothetical protein
LLPPSADAKRGRSAALAGLRTPLLDGNAITDAGARARALALAESPHLGGLRRLEGANNHLGEAGKAALRGRWPWARL